MLIDNKVAVNSSIDLCQLAASSAGIVYLPSFSVEEELINGQLIPLLEEYTEFTFDMYIVYPSKQYLSNKTKIFIDFMLDVMANDGTFSNLNLCNKDI